MDNHTETPGCADGGRGHYDPCVCGPTNDVLVDAFQEAVVDEFDSRGLTSNGKRTRDMEDAKAAILARLSSMGDLEAQVEALTALLIEARGMIQESIVSEYSIDGKDGSAWCTKVRAISLLSPNPKSEVKS